MSFDITEHADALAEMRAVQDGLDAGAEPIAEALAYCELAGRFRRERFGRLEAAKIELAGALEAVVDARNAFDEAIALEVLAMELLSLRRGGNPDVVRRYVFAEDCTR